MKAFTLLVCSHLNMIGLYMILADIPFWQRHNTCLSVICFLYAIAMSAMVYSALKFYLPRRNYVSGNNVSDGSEQEEHG